MSFELLAARSVPEGQWKLAGGGATEGSENHRNPVANRGRPSRGAGLRFGADSAAPFGAESFIRAGSGGFAALHHRLIAVTPSGS